MIPTTIPMLNILEPKMSPMLIPGVPWSIEKIATVISGMDVMTERIMNPAEASLRPVSSIRSSIDFIVRWLAYARTANDAANTTPKKIDVISLSIACTRFNIRKFKYKHFDWYKFLNRY